jgi:short-subunit dehydrogenase
MLYGIDVIIIGPGAVATPIWDKAEKEDVSIYKDTEYASPALEFQKYMVEVGKKGFPPEKVGEVVLQALTSSRPRVRYAVVPNALGSWLIPMLLPTRLVDAIIARRLGFRNKK